MYKMIFTVAAIALLASCDSAVSTNGDSHDGDTVAKRNEKNMMIVYDAIESGDTSKLREVIAEDAVDHNANPDGSDMRGRDSIVHFLGTIRNYFDNMNIDVISHATSADGQYHFSLVRMTGTARQNPWGMPEGHKMDDTSVDVVKLNDKGQVTEHWGFTSQADVMEMMSSMGNMPQQMHSQSGNKASPTQ